MGSRIVRRRGANWDGIAIAGYAPDEPGNVERHTLVGERASAAVPAGPKLELRYFRLAAGAASRLEKHQHEHYVIVGEGRGKAYVAGRTSDVAMHDVVYVAPLEPHQFVNAGDEPFGFYCVVPAERDFSQALSTAELDQIAASPAAAFVQPDAQRRPAGGSTARRSA
ncbi:MAG: cupin domain-containing protein [Candidatus Velthaea sp.]